jgi:hypothetical protein
MCQDAAVFRIQEGGKEFVQQFLSELYTCLNTCNLIIKLSGIADVMKLWSML